MTEQPKEPLPPKDATAASDSDDDEQIFHDARYPPDEEANLLSESNTHKSSANHLFSTARYSDAISTYDRALSFCPNYLDYEIAVLKSNIAACYLKLEDWKAAVDAAGASIQCLDRALAPLDEAASGDGQHGGDSGGVVELDDDSEEGSADAMLHKLQESDAQREDIKRIRAKALMRRARARTELSGWANLQGAEEDYKTLLGLGNLPPADERVARTALRELPDRINEAREREVGQMMGKLKDLGNGILKPFGLSTDNFNFVKDEKTGGYSMSFQ
ncbi:hypothetical protein AJ80_04941 [Polytolypa hystricis UAMH7299]|uniref:Tetratricopeptide repeat protein 1 n=1 Tax=Polytolypa hystricis (strain UAMH7299) TaxID=1447883 RepID=A0A2B7Y813_POLH7|nr:hypothetical protein AJ80_04941 [Polytolypa hystricis UAMH7299]